MEEELSTKRELERKEHAAHPERFTNKPYPKGISQDRRHTRAMVLKKAKRVKAKGQKTARKRQRKK